MKKSGYALSIISILTILFAGCANPNLVGERGNKINSQYSLQEQRNARSQIKVESSLPPGAVPLGEFMAERCHQYAQDVAPTDAVMLDDLVLLAFAQGADGLANPRFERESAILKNCWYLVRGKAVFFKNPISKQ